MASDRKIPWRITGRDKRSLAWRLARAIPACISSPSTQTATLTKQDLATPKPARSAAIAATSSDALPA